MIYDRVKEFPLEIESYDLRYREQHWTKDLPVRASCCHYKIRNRAPLVHAAMHSDNTPRRREPGYALPVGDALHLRGDECTDPITNATIPAAMCVQSVTVSSGNHRSGMPAQ